MSNRRRIAVLGLYNSGSTAVAGMLHRLGVNLGPPFWGGDTDPSNFYEPYDLSWHLRRWWTEPELKLCVTTDHRVKVLRAWAAFQEAIGPAPIGAKHPLLSLAGPDLLAAWGPETRFVWTWRPLANSVAALQRRAWFPGREPSIQETLRNALTEVIRCAARASASPRTTDAAQQASGGSLEEARQHSAVGLRQ